MPVFERDDAAIYYEEHGSGFPLLLVAPGGMRSTIDRWDGTPWNPIEQLSPRYRVIAMDQRNAGRSRGPIAAGDGWATYTGDQLALLAHLAIEKFHYAGMCIGGSYGLAIAAAAPERVAAAVLFQPIGLVDNRDAFFELFDTWIKDLDVSVSPEVRDSFRQAMFGGDFVFSVSRPAVAACRTPLLVLRGDDLYHPSEISREVVELARHATLIEHWKPPEHHATARRAIDQFLADHTPT